jgi:hypothetical protein
MIRMKGIRLKGDHHARSPSCFAVADRRRTRMPYSCELGRGCRRLHEIRAAVAQPIAMRMVEEHQQEYQHRDDHGAPP